MLILNYKTLIFWRKILIDSMIISREATLWILISIRLSVCQICNFLSLWLRYRSVKNKIRIKIQKISYISLNKKFVFFLLNYANVALLLSTIETQLVDCTWWAFSDSNSKQNMILLLIKKWRWEEKGEWSKKEGEGGKYYLLVKSIIKIVRWSIMFYLSFFKERNFLEWNLK